MSKKFPLRLRRILSKINRFLEQLHLKVNRYNIRTQFRARTTPGNWPTARPAPARGVYTRKHQSRQRYTAAEVKAFLQGQPPLDIERVQNIANRFQMGHLAEILDRPIPKRFHGREWLYTRLIMVTTRYAQKVPPVEIADSLSCFYNADDIEEAIDYVAGLVAESLNKANSFWL